MAVVTYGTYATNVERGSDIGQYIAEINNKLGSEQLIVERDVTTKGWLWSKDIKETYRAYWDLGNGEFQIIMAATGNGDHISAYLIGVLTGMDKEEKK